MPSWEIGLIDSKTTLDRVIIDFDLEVTSLMYIGKYFYLRKAI